MAEVPDAELAALSGGSGLGKEVLGPLQSEGNVTQAIIQPALTGEQVTQQGMERAQIRGNPLANVGKLVGGIAGLAEGASDAMAPLARAQGEAAGMQSVTRDANGNLQVQPTSSWMFGASGDQYAAGAASGVKAAASIQTTQDLNQIRTNHPGDPEGFKTASGDYITALGGGVLGAGTAAPSILLDAQQTAAQHYNNLVTQKAATDLNNSRISLESNIASKTNALNQLARQGGMQTPEYLQKYASMMQDYQSLGAVPQFGYPQERIDNELHQKMVEFHGSEIVGSMDQAFQDGGVVGAQKVLNDRVNQIGGITDSERAAYINQGNNRLSFLQNQNAGAVQQNQTRFKAAAGLGSAAPPALIDGIIGEATRLGDTDTAQRASALKTINALQPPVTAPPPASAAQPLGGAPGAAVPPAPSGPTRQAQAYNFFTGKGWSPNAAHAMVATLSGESGQGLNTGVYQGEGGFGPAGTTWDRLGTVPAAAEVAGGIANWNTARASAFNSWASSKGVDPNSFPAQLEYVHEEAVKMGLPIGSTASPAALTQQFTGQYERPAVNNGGIRWANYARNIGAGAAVPSANGVPFTAQQIYDNPYLGTEWVARAAADKGNRDSLATATLGGIEKGLDNNVMPTKENLALGLNAAAGNQKFDDQITRIGGKVAGLEAVTGGASISGGAVPAGGGAAPGAGAFAPGTGGALMAEARDWANNSPDLTHQAFGRAALAQSQAAVKALKDTPFEAAAAMHITPGVPQPLDYGKPGQIDTGALAQNLGQRANLAMSINRLRPELPPSAIAPAEVGAASNIISNGSPDQKLALLAAVSHLPEPARQATFDALKMGADGQTFAEAGRVALFDMPAAQDIVDGVSILKQDAHYAPKDDDLRPAFNTSLPSTDLAIPGARGRLYDSAKAWIAAQNFKTGNTAQAITPAIMQNALNAVTGGIVDFRGTKVVVPIPGMSQGQFIQSVAGLTDGDLHGATFGAGGSPIPAASLKGSWNAWLGASGPLRLQSADPDSGKYLLIDGPAAAPRKAVDPTTGRALIIDLSKGPIGPPQAPAPAPTAWSDFRDVGKALGHWLSPAMAGGDAAP
ncbi:MAG: phage tail tip lysozyme [Methylocella sp.]